MHASIYGFVPRKQKGDLKYIQPLSIDKIFDFSFDKKGNTNLVEQYRKP